MQDAGIFKHFPLTNKRCLIRQEMFTELPKLCHGSESRHVSYSRPNMIFSRFCKEERRLSVISASAAHKLTPGRVVCYHQQRYEREGRSPTESWVPARALFCCSNSSWLPRSNPTRSLSGDSEQGQVYSKAPLTRRGRVRLGLDTLRTCRLCALPVRCASRLRPVPAGLPPASPTGWALRLGGETPRCSVTPLKARPFLSFCFDVLTVSACVLVDTKRPLCSSPHAHGLGRKEGGRGGGGLLSSLLPCRRGHFPAVLLSQHLFALRPTSGQGQ